MTANLIWNEMAKGQPREEGIYLISVRYPGYTKRTDRYDVKMREYYIDVKGVGRWKNTPGIVEYWAKVSPVIIDEERGQR